jgi:oligoribonuclease
MSTIQPHPDNLAWVDCEMTGLDPEEDIIIEIAMVITDKFLNIIAEGPVLAIHQPEAILKNMDAWNTKQHTRSGLVERVKASTISIEEAEEVMLDFVMRHVPPQKSPMCGNTICQDRRFMAKYMPTLEKYFHYRNLDVSVFQEVAKRWNPMLLKGFTKSRQHLALLDIRESVDELKYYRNCFLICED